MYRVKNEVQRYVLNFLTELLKEYYLFCMSFFAEKMKYFWGNYCRTFSWTQQILYGVTRSITSRNSRRSSWNNAQWNSWNATKIELIGLRGLFSPAAGETPEGIPGRRHEGVPGDTLQKISGATLKEILGKLLKEFLKEFLKKSREYTLRKFLDKILK